MNEEGQESIFKIYEGPKEDSNGFDTLPTFLTCILYWNGFQLMHPSALEKTTSG